MCADTDSSFFYFDAPHAIQVHDWIIEHSGGLMGTRDINGLISPLEHIKNDDYYPTLASKLTHLVFSINKNHAFADGNKRSSIALGAYFLEINGYGFLANHFAQKMENIVVWVADNLIDKNLLANIIASLTEEIDYNDILKLRIIHAVSRGEI